MEFGSNGPVSGKASSHCFIEAAASETIAPRDPDINEEADNCCTWDASYLCHIVGDEVG